ncbi:CUB domain-containing protein 1 [Pholidichthys leucotaenia]
MRLCGTCALLGLLLLSRLDASECLKKVIRPDKGSTVTVSTSLPLDQCSVCEVTATGENSCHTSVSLDKHEVNVTLLFNCSQPIKQSYTVTVARSIECTKDACNPTAVKTQPFLLSEFARTFTWELKAPEKTVVSLNILGDGLMESSQPCPDGYKFLVALSKTNSKSQTQYCRGGSVTQLDLSNQALMSLKVAPNTPVDPVLFQAGPTKGRTMVVSVDSSTTVILGKALEELACEVCIAKGTACSSTEKTLTSVENLSLEFSCPKPQDVYIVQVKKKIECTKTSCTPAAAEVDPNLFKDFKRSLAWDIRIPDRTVLTLDFPGDKLKSTSAAEKCQDGYEYLVSTTRGDGKIKTNKYCKGGTVSNLELLGVTTVIVEAPKDGALDSVVFNVKVNPRSGRTLSVTPDSGTIVYIQRVNSDADCSVCVGKEPNQECNSNFLRLELHRNTLVDFTCPQPQSVYTVEINKEIDCTKNPSSVQVESSLFPDFTRSFTWDLRVDDTRAFQVDFPEPGMRQIPDEETCPDQNTYALIAYLRSGLTVVGKFCKGGSMTTVMVRLKGRVVLQVPGDAKLDPVDFKVSIGPETNMMAIVKANLPRGVSDTTFITPNYPRSFPDNQKMQWDFVVPGMHNYSVHFNDHTPPECLENQVEVEYQKEGKKATKVFLTDRQPKHQQGNFNMVLRNCKTNVTLPGLALNYSVSVMRSGHPVLCTVDLTKHKGVSLQIEKVGSDPFCEMSINSEVKKKISVAAATKASLSFLDCPNDEMRLTASKVIDCKNVTVCNAAVLTVPTLDLCLPMPLHNFTWHINIPKDGTVDLVSPTGSLRQSLPGQKCNQSFILHVAEGDGFSVGDFCFNGVLKKVQVHSNIAITARAQDFKKTRGPFLNISFSPEIKEAVMYRVTPEITSPTMLATPNWPQGMREQSTISWIVTVPSHYQAHLQFINVSQPKCESRHTSIKVQMLGYEEELMSRREDEDLEKLLVPQSFYLNMSNCKPEKDHFGVVTKIVLEKKNNLLAIILGVVGALLLLVIVLAAVFITKKKKKDKMNKESSIYMGKESIFRPSDRHFSKVRSENDSHIYDSIDESMVYGHLMREYSYTDGTQESYKGIPMDSYQTFTGATDGQLPVIKEPEPEADKSQYRTFLDPSETFIPSRPRTPIQRQESLGFEDSRMVDNVLYTFKNTGDINTIKLTEDDTEPQPAETEGYL